MASFRMRGTSCTAHVRIKKGGELVYQEFNTFRGRGAEALARDWARRLEDLHFHDLRREGISRLFKAGYTIPEVSKISGHQSWDMLKIYTEIHATDVLEKFQ